MEYIDKLKNVGENVRSVFMKGVVDTVFTVQTSLKDVLPGNPLTREYEALYRLSTGSTIQISHVVGGAGAGCCAWRIFAATKKSTKEAASVFLLEKRSWNTLNKHAREELIDQYRSGVQQLTRLKHPRLLSIQHHLEESRDSLAFATEPVLGSLADCFQGSSDPPTDIEIRYGIMQLCDALTFLHKDGHILHGNICPESILVSEHSGVWKLGCFEHCLQGTIHAGCAQPTYVRRNINFDVIEFANPNLNYLAPELLDSCVNAQPSEKSDMFAVGSLIFTLYNNGRTMFDCKPTDRRSMRKNIKANIKMRKDIPIIVQRAIQSLISMDPSGRPSANDFLKSTFTDEVTLKALEYLDSMFQVDNLQRSMFYKTLLTLIPSIPSNIRLRRLMSAFEVEFVNTDMLPFIMPNVFVIAELCSEPDYNTHVLPRLKTVFRQTVNIQTLSVIMENMQLLLKKTNTTDVRDYILPVLYNALDTKAQQIQEMCLGIIPSFSDLVDGSSMRSAILPRIKRICIETSILSIRVNCLLCLGKLTERFDKWMIVDDVIPILHSVPSKEPAVLMTILGVIKVALSSKDEIPKEALATKFIPLLAPLSIESGLNQNQFNAFMQVIRDILGSIESSQRKKFEQLTAYDGLGSKIPNAQLTSDEKLGSLLSQISLHCQPSKRPSDGVIYELSEMMEDVKPTRNNPQSRHYPCYNALDVSRSRDSTPGRIGHKTGTVRRSQMSSDNGAQKDQKVCNKDELIDHKISEMLKSRFLEFVLQIASPISHF